MLKGAGRWACRRRERGPSATLSQSPRRTPQAMSVTVREFDAFRAKAVQARKQNLVHAVATVAAEDPIQRRCVVRGGARRDFEGTGPHDTGSVVNHLL